MKRILIFIFCFNFVPEALGQNNTQGLKQVEIYVLTQNFNLDFMGIFYEIKSVQYSVLENNADRYIFNSTSDPKYINSTLPLNAPGINSENLIVESSDINAYQSWEGFDFVSGSEEYNPDQPDFAYGIYELSVYAVLQDYSIIKLPGTIYLDYRDSYYPALLIPGSYTWADIYIKYDLATYSFYTSRFNAPSSFDDLGELLPENSINRIWELADLPRPINVLFPNSFWLNCLIYFEKNNHPYLIWSAYPDESQNISSYKIYRGLPNPLKPRIFNFTPIATVNNNVFEYIDYDILLNPNGDEVRYYVTPVVNGSESVPSNTVSTNGGLYKESTPPTQHSLAEFKLEQNYPNPFNPTTEITYSIPKSSFVNLKVYDTLGKEIAVLVNERKERGRYTVEFNAGDLPSGMYIYRITAGKYRASGKMLLLK